MRAHDSLDPGPPRLSPAGDARRRQHAHGVLHVGPAAGTFDDGIEKALRRLLADPEFVYRREIAPAACEPAGAITSATWRWHPGCRFSSGAACRTTSS